MPYQDSTKRGESSYFEALTRLDERLQKELYSSHIRQESCFPVEKTLLGKSAYSTISKIVRHIQEYVPSERELEISLRQIMHVIEKEYLPGLNKGTQFEKIYSNDPAYYEILAVNIIPYIQKYNIHLEN